MKKKRIAGNRNTGSNDPCPCGSGKKFKRCHGAIPPHLEAPPFAVIKEAQKMLARHQALKAVKQFKKPYLVVDSSRNHDPVSVIAWAKANKIKILNVAGPRETKIPGIHDRAVEFLRKAFK
jgi:hypothetical protein